MGLGSKRCTRHEKASSWTEQASRHCILHEPKSWMGWGLRHYIRHEPKSWMEVGTIQGIRSSWKELQRMALESKPHILQESRSSLEELEWKRHIRHGVWSWTAPLARKREGTGRVKSLKAQEQWDKDYIRSHTQALAWLQQRQSRRQRQKSNTCWLCFRLVQ